MSGQIRFPLGVAIVTIGWLGLAIIFPKLSTPSTTASPITSAAEFLSLESFESVLLQWGYEQARDSAISSATKEITGSEVLANMVKHILGAQTKTQGFAFIMLDSTSTADDDIFSGKLARYLDQDEAIMRFRNKEKCTGDECIEIDLKTVERIKIFKERLGAIKYRFNSKSLELENQRQVFLKDSAKLKSQWTQEQRNRDRLDAKLASWKSKKAQAIEALDGLNQTMANLEVQNAAIVAERNAIEALNQQLQAAHVSYLQEVQSILRLCRTQAGVGIPTPQFIQTRAIMAKYLEDHGELPPNVEQLTGSPYWNSTRDRFRNHKNALNALAERQARHAALNHENVSQRAFLVAEIQSATSYLQRIDTTLRKVEVAVIASVDRFSEMDRSKQKLTSNVRNWAKTLLALAEAHRDIIRPCETFLHRREADLPNLIRNIHLRTLQKQVTRDNGTATTTYETIPPSPFDGTGIKSPFDSGNDPFQK